MAISKPEFVMAKFIIIGTNELVQHVREKLFILENASYDVEDIITNVINGCVKYDINGCVDYDLLTSRDLSGLTTEEEIKAFSETLIFIALELNRIFRRCQLYNTEGYLPFYVWGLHSDDLVLTREPHAVKSLRYFTTDNNSRTTQSSSNL